MDLQDLKTKCNAILKSTKDKYETIYNERYEKLNDRQLMDKLSQSFEENKNLKNKIINVKSYMDYIDLIQKEIDKIQIIIYKDDSLDIENGCFYFGGYCLYVTKDINKYTLDQQCDILFNNIIHYIGALYLISSDFLRKKYIIFSMKIIYGEQWLNNTESLEFKNHLILDISKQFVKFIIKNKDNLSFIRYDVVRNETLIYRLMINKRIECKANVIAIDDNNIRILNDVSYLDSIFEKFNIKNFGEVKSIV